MCQRRRRTPSRQSDRSLNPAAQASSHLSSRGYVPHIERYANTVRSVYLSVNMHPNPETYYIGTVFCTNVAMPSIVMIVNFFFAFWLFDLTEPGPDGAGGPGQSTSGRSGAKQGVGRRNRGPVSDGPAGNGRHRQPGLLAGDWAAPVSPTEECRSLRPWM